MLLKTILDNSKDSVYLSQKVIENYGITAKKVNLHFGTWQTEATTIIDNSLTPDTICISEKLTEGFTLPVELPFEIRVRANHIYLGPVIAFIAFQSQNKMTLEGLEKEFTSYLTNYAHIKGLIYICAKDTIDTSNKIIKGYYYCPSTDANTYPWKPGVFPYPDAVYNRAVISKEIYNDLFLTIGDKIFNTYSDSSFDKWELWEMLSSTPHLEGHLPQTAKLDNLKTLNDMLDQHQAVYLKPAVSTYSKGIIKVRKGKKGYIFIYPKKHRKAKATIKRPVETAKATALINSFKAKNYLIQQAINMKRYDKRGIDFRVIMQKNGLNNWNCMGVFAKCGKRRSIITNFTQAGFLLSGLSAFKKAFKMNRRQALEKVNELKGIAFKVCEVFDKHGNFGDLGIDLMVDKNKKVWILEVNTVDPYHKFPLFINDRDSYQKIVSMPLEYAKFLSGFKV